MKLLPMNKPQILKHEADLKYELLPAREYILHKMSLGLDVNGLKLFDYVAFKAKEAYDRLSFKRIFRYNDYIEIHIKPCEYFSFKGRQRPSKKDYEKLYRLLDQIAVTRFLWECISQEMLLKEKICMVSRYRQVFDKNGRIVDLTLDFSVAVIWFFCWKGKNIKQDLKITEKLNRKYSYILFGLLKYSNFEMHTYKKFDMEELKILLKCDEVEKYFRYNLRKAVEEICRDCKSDWEVLFVGNQVVFRNKDFEKIKEIEKVGKLLAPLMKVPVIIPDTCHGKLNFNDCDKYIMKEMKIICQDEHEAKEVM